MDLVEGVYRVTRSFPKEELYALTNQIGRAAVSIPSNIAEGQGRGGNKEFHQFLRVSYGSLREVETQLLIAERMQYLNAEQVNSLLDLAGEVGRLMQGLMKSLVA